MFLRLTGRFADNLLLYQKSKTAINILTDQCILCKLTETLFKISRLLLLLLVFYDFLENMFYRIVFKHIIQFYFQLRNANIKKYIYTFQSVCSTKNYDLLLKHWIYKDLGVRLK